MRGQRINQWPRGPQFTGIQDSESLSVIFLDAFEFILIAPTNSLSTFKMYIQFHSQPAQIIAGYLGLAFQILFQVVPYCLEVPDVPVAIPAFFTGLTTHY
jgi:hypothetical protein